MKTCRTCNSLIITNQKRDKPTNLHVPGVEHERDEMTTSEILQHHQVPTKVQHKNKYYQIRELCATFEPELQQRTSLTKGEGFVQPFTVSTRLGLLCSETSNCSNRGDCFFGRCVGVCEGVLDVF